MSERRGCGSSRRTETSHVTYCARDEGHTGPCTFADGNGAHLWLDGYEIANLREALDAIREAKLYPLMGGDWFEQVRTKLRGFYLPHNNANRPADEIVAALARLVSPTEESK